MQDNHLSNERRWSVFAALSVWLLVAYFAIVLPFDRAVPVINRWYVAAALLAASAVIVGVAVRAFLLRRCNLERIKDITLASLTSLVTLLVVDGAYKTYRNIGAQSLRAEQVDFQDRLDDPWLWQAEVVPVRYTPPGSGFWLMKQGHIRAGRSFGDHYYPALLRHPLMRESVLELREVEYAVDEYGLRNDIAPRDARVFALGDSFCFGYGVPHDAVFSEQLGALLGEPVYNMGVPGAAPLGEYLLLEHMLETYPADFKPERLLWVIYEGNDLEDDDSPDLFIESPGPALSMREMFDGTLVGAVASFPSLLREQSVLRILLEGGVTLKAGDDTRTIVEQAMQLEGEPLAFPLYHSPRFGYRFFWQELLWRAAQPESYVTENRRFAKVVDAFGRMRQLANERNIQVTVVIAPSAVRLYWDAFTSLPPISEEPYFIRHVQRLAAENGFESLDLSALLRPYAETELLYFRDDTHWNSRGHARTAEILANHIAGSPR